MAAGFSLVAWNRFKRGYDALLLTGMLLLFAAHLGAGFLLAPAGQHLSEIQLLIRASGAAAFSLLTIILCLGPLARLTPRALPLVYNRRHMGGACFGLALIHGALVVLWYHGLSEVNSFVSLLVSNPRYDSPGGFPFESLGLAALLILFVMAATSHDFWNGVLGLGLGAAFPSPGPGAWDQGKKLAVTGTIYPEPYTHLLTQDLGYGLRPVFLVGAGKDRAPLTLPKMGWEQVASLCERCD